jgi:hypothetical protein
MVRSIQVMVCAWRTRAGDPAMAPIASEAPACPKEGVTGLSQNRDLALAPSGHTAQAGGAQRYT